MNMRHFAVGVLAAAQIGCAVGPDYVAPEAREVEFHNLAGAGADRFDSASPDAAWWQTFEDPILSDLIERALANDFDVRIAEARLRTTTSGVTQEFAS
jgi:multidrug efflux system outer membrane protein